MTIAEPAGSSVNNFTVKFANVNGTGSSSANTLVMRSIFRMGVPVSARNLFPSNIQGLPTWYEVRVSRDGYTARSERCDLMVAMDTQTRAHDVQEVRPGGYVLWDSTWPLDRGRQRDDITCLGLPLARLCSEAFEGGRARILLQNVVTAGAVTALLGVDLDESLRLLDESYAGKERLREANARALLLGHDYARRNFPCPLPCHVERMSATAGSILIDGNTTAALGCLYAGATVAAWYPITPSTSIMDQFADLCARYRVDPESGANNYIVLQAEDELGSIGMVLGACWNGARAFTATSGPGISLMNELLGLAYYTEIPAVVIDVQRTGPSTGLPTRTQQSDLMECAYASHGDTKHILLFPRDPAECFDFAIRAFDLAERFQTPVMMLSDVEIGMNEWMIPELSWDGTYVPDRGRVLRAEQLAEIDVFRRYGDADAESVTPRTLPGVGGKGAYFTRGSGHNRSAGYSEEPEEYRAVVDRLLRKHAAARAHVPEPIIEAAGNRIGLVTIGSCDPAAREGRDRLAAEGIGVDYMRVRGFPFGPAVERFLATHEQIYVLEQNRDAQLRALLLLETAVSKEKLRSILVYSGLPATAADVVEGVRAQVDSAT